MIYEEERTVDEMVDDILGDDPVRETASRASRLDANFRPDTPAVDIPDPARPDENGVRSTRTPSTGGPQAGTEDARRAPSKEVTERASCRKCGRMFVRPKQSARTLCQDCFAASHEHRKAAKKSAANDRQIKTENSAEQKGTEKVETKENTVAQAAEKLWDALGEAETKANTPEAPPQERAPEDMTAGELVDALEAGMRREPGDVVLALYQAARDVARTSGIQTRVLIETMYEIDCTLSHIGGV